MCALTLAPSVHRGSVREAVAAEPEADVLAPARRCEPGTHDPLARELAVGAGADESLEAPSERLELLLALAQNLHRVVAANVPRELVAVVGLGEDHLLVPPRRRVADTSSDDDRAQPVAVRGKSVRRHDMQESDEGPRPEGLEQVDIADR